MLRSRLVSRKSRSLTVTLIIVLLVGGGVAVGLVTFLPRIGGLIGTSTGGTSSDGCSFSESFTDNDGSKTTNVSDCLPPGLPASIPLVAGKPVDGSSVTGDNGYGQFDVTLAVTDASAATQQVTQQLTDAKLTPVPVDESTYDIEFTGNGYDVGVTISSTGPHGPTVDYTITTQSTDPSSADPTSATS